MPEPGAQDTNQVQCERHGLTYAPRSARGCVVCRREDAEQLPSSCSACHRPLDLHVGVCPYCGTATAPRSSAQTQQARRGALRRRLPYYACAALVLLLLSGLLRYLAKERTYQYTLDEELLVVPSTAPRDYARPPLSIDDVDPVPHVSLARMRHVGNKAYADDLIHRPEDGDRLPYNIWRRAHELGANASHTTSPREIDDGRFELITTLYVLHAGDVTSAQRNAWFPRNRACLIVKVVDGSAADAGGLRAGDVVATVHEAPVAVENECHALRDTLDAVPRGGAVTATVLRKGVPVPLILVRPEAGMYGYTYFDVPVLNGAL